MTNFLHKISNKYASKWLILFSDLCIIIVTYFIAHIIRYNFQFDFDIIILFKQLPYIVIVSAFSLSYS